MAALEKAGKREGADERFRPVRQTLMPFSEFVEATRLHHEARARHYPIGD